MKKPVTVFGRRYNREFVQTIMDLILSFHDTEMLRGTVSIRITIQKNLYMGAVWLRFKPYCITEVAQKRRYNNNNWVALHGSRAHRYLREAVKSS